MKKFHMSRYYNPNKYRLFRLQNPSMSSFEILKAWGEKKITYYLAPKRKPLNFATGIITQNGIEESTGIILNFGFFKWPNCWNILISKKLICPKF